MYALLMGSARKKAASEAFESGCLLRHSGRLTCAEVRRTPSNEQRALRCAEENLRAQEAAKFGAQLKATSATFAFSPTK